MGDVPMRATALEMNAPKGVIGIVPNANSIFHAPLRAIVAALSMGNSVVMTAPENFPLSVLDLGLLAENSDLPAGAFNVISGNAKELGDAMLKHAGIEALWDFYDLGAMRAEAASNLKSVLTGDALGLPDAALLKAAVNVKTIWLPYGALY